MIAALFVQTGGCYFGLPDVDPWDEPRDARKYDGPHAVVAHPPCARWSTLAAVVEHRYGKMRGDDDGCFASALASVRQWGGVIEHPARSGAWRAFNLPMPYSDGGWQRGMCGGWSCQVDQGNYGHPADKATWLYGFGCELPSLRWHGQWRAPDAKRTDVEHQSRAARILTPLPFRDLLITMARSVKGNPS